MKTETCCGCGGEFKQEIGPCHPYMLSSAGCWSAYGRLLAREYENQALFHSSHRLTVDAYALQHPGDQKDRRANQSVCIHFVSLHLVFAHNFSHKVATNALKVLAANALETWPCSHDAFEFTVKDVWSAPIELHNKCVEEWARSAYSAWAGLVGHADDLIEKLNLLQLIGRR